MKITKTRVEWNLGWANDPRLVVEVDSLPPFRDHIYTEHPVNGGTMYLSKHPTGVVHFLYHNPRSEDGFGGNVYHLNMKDGTVRKVKGPWSSRAGVVNAMGFGPVVDVIFHEEGRGLRAGAIALETVLPHLPEGVEMYEENHHGEPWYIPTFVGKTPRESKEYLRSLGAKKDSDVPAVLAR